jgi:3-isopropylmalate/(R)-2-methylmalate dehydratase large subunit
LNLSANQLKALEENSKKYGISHWGLEQKTESFIIGPENGITLPGATIVWEIPTLLTEPSDYCFRIGTSEVEMVLSTQCIMQAKT